MDLQSIIENYGYAAILVGTFLVHHRNPGPLGQVRVQRLCHLYGSMLLNDQVVPTTMIKE